LNQVSDILLQTRSKKGWNKSQMARTIGVSSQLYGQYERGEKVPGGDFFLKWQNVFGVPLGSKSETNVSRELPGKKIEDQDMFNETILQAILRLADNNDKILDANKEAMNNTKIALESNQTLANTNADMFAMLKESSGVSSELTEIVANQKMMLVYLKALFGLGVDTPTQLTDDEMKEQLEEMGKEIAAAARKNRQSGKHELHKKNS
jgi:transcriptional regulator with XRE-family HTH domain